MNDTYATFESFDAPWAAALVPAVVGSDARVLPILKEFAGAVDATDAFRRLSRADAEIVATAIAFDLVHRINAAEFLNRRAHDAQTGRDGRRWDDSSSAHRALAAAAALATARAYAHVA